MADQADGILSAFLRRKRIELALPFIKGKVIDMGCGVGKLAEHVEPDDYVGIDKDIESIYIAKSKYPNHKFYTSEESEDIKDKFDTVVSLAVVEHVENPLDFIVFLKSLLTKDGSIVITTPHPRSGLIHKLGSKMGLFSSHAEKEHEELIDIKKMTTVAKQANVRIVKNKTFLFGMNQLFVLRKTPNE